jgi:hypothetical protein
MFILLRRIERWLHQHIFKVGWLMTQNYQTTTILYYTIFLPGVVLHELVYWLAAGMLNVRADRAIKWPEAQEVGELKLNFVRVNPKASKIRKAIIVIAPLLVGLVLIWYIAHNIFDITAVFRQMSSGNLRDVVTAFNMLVGAPLFWMWVYIIFTIANTMYPSIPKDLQGWRSVLLGLAAVALALLVLGLGGEIFEALQSPLSELIFVLQATFVLMIAVDVVMVLILGLIEYTIEHVTGNSATFRGGKMITVTREEALDEQRKQREQELKEQAKKRNPAADASLKSIYSLVFSIPGIPPQEPVTVLKEHSQASIEMPAVVVEEEKEEKKPAAMPLFGGIASNTPDAPKPLTEEQKQQRESIAAKINIPERIGTPKPTTAPEEKAIEPAISTPKEDSPVGTASSLSAASEDEHVGEKPLTSRFGGFNKPAPKEDSPVGTASSLSTASEDEPVGEKPVTSRFGAFTKPVISTPKDENAEDEPVGEKPVTSRFGSFNKAAISTPKDENAEDESDEKPITSRFGGFNKPAPKEDSPVGTTSSLSDASEGEPDEKPVTSRFAGFNKPAISTPKDEDAEDEPAEEKPNVPTTSRFGGFTKPSSEETKPPTTSRFGASPFKPLGETEKTEKPAATTGRFASTEFKRVEDEQDEDEKPATTNRLGGNTLGGSSRFGAARPAPKPLSKEDDNDEDEADEEAPTRSSSPLLGRPSSPFGSPRPAPKTFGKVDDEDELEDEDEAPRSRVSGFGLLGKRPKDEEIVYEDDEDDFRNFDDDEDYVDSDDED